MNKIKFLVNAIALLLFSANMTAQSAADIMDSAAKQFKKNKSVESNYTIIFTDNGQRKTMTGGIVMQGNKYVNVMQGTKIWFNGKTQWTYVKENEEVTVTNPDKSDMAANNPYYFINSYKEDFNVSLLSETASAYEMKLTPKQKGSDIQSVVLKFSKTNYRPLSLNINSGNGNVEIRIVSYKTGRSFRGNSFNFNKKKYPDVEIIDLR